MPKAKTRNYGGHSYIVENFASTKAQAEQVANKLRKTSFVGGTHIWKGKTGYEIGWRY